MSAAQRYYCTTCKSTYETAGLCIECGVNVILPANPANPYAVYRVPRPGETAAAALLAEAEHIDPGLAAAALAPIGSPQREQHERIRDHYIAYGIRRALDSMGLMPDDD